MKTTITVTLEGGCNEDEATAIRKAIKREASQWGSIQKLTIKTQGSVWIDTEVITRTSKSKRVKA